MTKTITQICFALVLCGIPMVAGCGSSSEPEIVGGSAPQYEVPADAMEQYQKQMSEKKGS